MTFYEFMDTLFGEKSKTNMDEDFRKAEHRQNFFQANKVRFIEKGDRPAIARKEGATTFDFSVQT